MASFPPIPQIVGKHGPVFEAYYKQADPNNTGSLGALDAANFMKKSGLKDNVLSQIWDMADPGGKGYLEKQGFFVALKLISLAQNGQDPSIAKLTMETAHPNLGPFEIAPEVETVPGGPWALSANEKTKYDQVFDSLQPVNNLLAGDKVRPVLLNSKLPMDILGRIWELSDLDRDGYLDREEFALAMHLVHKGMAKEAIPNVLPLSLIPPSKRKGLPARAVLPGAVPVLVGLGGPGGVHDTPATRSDSPSIRGHDIWGVIAAEKGNYDVMFRKADLDMDGFVSGQEIRDIFLQSGLQNNVLAHIWNLCDMKGIGKLNSDQFALAMHLVQQKLKGVDPPPQLTPEMIPPSQRSSGAADTAAFGVADGGTSAGPYGHVADFSAIKELDMIQKEIDDIKKEKLRLEAEQQQQTADIRICQGEVQVLEKELNSITGMLHQLESQKIEAQKVLDELDEKKSDLETSVREIKQKCDDEQKQIDTLNSQIQNQQKSALEYDEELNNLRIELGILREEENKLEQKVETGKTQLQQLAKSHKDVILQASQTKTRVQHLQDQYRAVNQGIAEYSVPQDTNTFISTPPNASEDQTSTRATQGSPVSTISDFSMGSAFEDDPFKNKDPFGGGGTQADPFAADDPFKSSDPFKSEGITSDPFTSDDPFKDAFPTSNTTNISQTSSEDLIAIDPFPPCPPARTHSKSSKPSLPLKQLKTLPPRPVPPKRKTSASSPSKPKRPESFGAGAFPNDPFGSPVSGTSTGEDRFSSSDPFGSSFGSSGGGNKQVDSFDPFGSSSNKPQKSIGDLFGSDPFAPSQPAKTRSESPRPALPPKQKKAPPPRPAPPKGKSPASSPSKPKKPDPFGAGAFPNDPFGTSDPFSGSSAGTSVTSSAFSDDELAWAFTSSTASPPATCKMSSIKSPKSKSSSKSKKLSKQEQEEADYQFALKLSRGEVGDSNA